MIENSLRLCGATYLLSTHPEILARLRQEIDSAFDSEEDITISSVQRLKYLTAVLDETLRIYPAAVGSVPRIIQRHGEMVGGYFLPGGVSLCGKLVKFGQEPRQSWLTGTQQQSQTTVDIWHWAMYHNPANFIEPEQFAPERWLGEPGFSRDKRAAFEPFSTGKRNCIGQK